MTTPATCATQATSEGLDARCLAMQMPLLSRAVLQVFPCCCLPGRPGDLQRGSHAAKFPLPAPHLSACSVKKKDPISFSFPPHTDPPHHRSASVGTANFLLEAAFHGPSVCGGYYRPEMM